MTELIKHSFLIVGIMMLSLLIFSVIFGDTGRSFIWTNIEPVFQNSWEDMTLDDGKKRKQVYDNIFYSAKEAPSW